MIHESFVEDLIVTNLTAYADWYKKDKAAIKRNPESDMVAEIVLNHMCLSVTPETMRAMRRVMRRCRRCLKKNQQSRAKSFTTATMNN